MTRFREIVDVVARLRAPDGCPWDREQTAASLRPYLVEEAYEVLDAIGGGDDAALCDELGDVLLQVVLHAQIAGETGAFTIDDVIGAIVAKMVRRHPHVFGDATVRDAAEVTRNWARIKREERRTQAPDGPASALDGLPRELPALHAATRIGEKAETEKVAEAMKDRAQGWEFSIPKSQVKEILKRRDDLLAEVSS
jgi:MazG family protein